MSNKVLKPKASTQEHLDVEDIADDLVVLKTGWVALVMSTTAVNFDLLSEAEQDATIYAYGAFLNSLSFPVQTLIRNKRADITAYFQTLEEAESTQANPDLKRQIQKYEDFLRSIVQQKAVLDKKFYLIINYSPLESGFKGSGKAGSMSPKSKAQLLEAARVALSPKRDHVVKQTARLGLSTKQLTSQELIELFYDIYNPAPTGTQRVLLDSESYTTPIVEPAIENPAQAQAVAGNYGATASAIQPVAIHLASNQSNLRPVPGQPVPTGGINQPVSGGIQFAAGNVQQQAPVYGGQAGAAVPQIPVQVPPIPAPATPQQQAVTSPNQTEALKSLQEAAARASQALGQAAPTSQPQGESGVIK